MSADKNLLSFILYLHLIEVANAYTSLNALGERPNGFLMVLKGKTNMLKTATKIFPVRHGPS
jgi:hypothetical protein